MISERPEKWVVLKITNKDGIHYKIFGTWAGGYLDGDRWRLNSGISSIEEDENHYYFYGYSGSCYMCNKNDYGVATTYSKSVLDEFQIKALEKDTKIEVMGEDTDWLTLIEKNDK